MFTFTSGMVKSTSGTTNIHSSYANTLAYSNIHDSKANALAYSNIHDSKANALAYLNTFPAQASILAISNTHSYLFIKFFETRGCHPTLRIPHCKMKPPNTIQ
jgi:uncharacterized protein